MQTKKSSKKLPIFCFDLFINKEFFHVNFHTVNSFLSVGIWLGNWFLTTVNKSYQEYTFFWIWTHPQTAVYDSSQSSYSNLYCYIVTFFLMVLLWWFWKMARTKKIYIVGSSKLQKHVGVAFLSRKVNFRCFCCSSWPSEMDVDLKDNRN